MLLESFLSSQWVFAISINFIIISFAQRLPLLTKKGWVHAAVLGSILWGSLGWEGWLSVTLYLILGSLVTRLGYENKKQMGIEEKRGGKRGPENVWGSAATGAIIALFISAGLGNKTLLLLGFAASFSAKLADTFGSEIGKRFGSTTILITTFKKVKPGTEGAISLEGTLASFVGSIFMTLIMYALSLVPNVNSAFLIISIGFFATLLESIIGAVFQQRILWLNNENVNFLQTLIAAILAIIFGYKFIT